MSSLLLTGVRDGVTYGDVLAAIALSGFTGITKFISLAARGSDSFGKKWAKRERIPVIEVPVVFSKEDPEAEVKQIRQAIKMSDKAIILVNDCSIRAQRIYEWLKLETNIPTYVYRFEQISVSSCEKLLRSSK